MKKTVVGIDPGMTTGWAIDTGSTIAAGTWQLTHKSEHPLMRLHDYLSGILSLNEVSLLCYEEPVARGMAARSLNRQMGIIILVCERLRIPHYPVNPGTLKKHATGSGRADKEQMLEAAQGRGWEFTDHNAVDALWLADYGRSLLIPTMGETP